MEHSLVLPVSHVTTSPDQRCRLTCIERNTRRKRKSRKQTDYYDCRSITTDSRANVDHQSATVYALGPFQVGNSVAFALELVSLRQRPSAVRSVTRTSTFTDESRHDVACWFGATKHTEHGEHRAIEKANKRVGGEAKLRDPFKSNHQGYRRHHTSII